MAGISITQIKEEYKQVSHFGLMEYESEMVFLNAFIQKYDSDERAGVKSIIKQAEKKLAALKAELERINKMTL